MRFIMRTIGLLFITVAVILFFWQDIREYYTDKINDRIIEAFHNDENNVHVNTIESFITGVENYEAVEIKESSQPRQDINLNEDMAGILNIDSADISEPLYYGEVTDEKLRNGISFINEGDNLNMQNLPIAGHRVEGAGIRFNYLDRAKVGDSIELVTRKEVKEYEIKQIFEVDPSQVEVMNQSEGEPQELTLITCDDYNPETLLFEKRMIVKAQIVE